MFSKQSVRPAKSLPSLKQQNLCSSERVKTHLHVEPQDTQKLSKHVRAKYLTERRGSKRCRTQGIIDC